MKPLIAIASVDMNWGIGYKGDLIYRFSEDLYNFKKKTIGHVVIMGRKTFDSLPNKSPLSDRINIVLSRTTLNRNDIIQCTSIDQLKYILDTNSSIQDKKLFVIGGGIVYKQLLPYCNIVDLTRVYLKYDTVDAYFPNLENDSNWYLMYCSTLFISSKDKLHYANELWKRV